MRVELPDGRVVDGVPEGTTKAELVRKLREANYIDIPTAAKMLELEIVDPSVEEGMSAMERFTAGVGRGATDVVEGVQQMALEGADLIDPLPGSRAELFTKDAQESRAADGDLGVAGTAGRFAGNVAGAGAIAAPVAAASGVAALGKGGLLARTAANTLGGAAGGASAFVDEGQSRATNAVIGGAAGAALTPIMGFIGNRLQRMTRRGGAKLTRPARLRAAQVELANSQGLTAAQKGRIAHDIADGFTPEQAMRKFELEELGAVPTRGRVTGDLDDLRFEVDERRVGGPIADAEQASRAGIDASMRAQVGRLSTGNIETGSAGDIAEQALESGRTAAKARTTAAFRSVDDRLAQMPEGATLPTNSLAKAAEDNVDFFVLPELAPVASRLQRIGIMDASGDVTPTTITPQQAEFVRRLLGRIKPQGEAKKVVGELRAALDEDVIQGVGEDVFKGARAVAKEGFDAFDNRKMVSDILAGKIGPEQIVGRLQSAGTKAKDVRELFDTLGAVNPQAASTLRASILDDVFSKARGAVDVDGVPTITPASLRNRVRALGMTKLEAALGKPEAEALVTFSDRLSRLMTVDPRTAGPGTAGDAERKMRQAFGRLLDMAPGGRWITGAFRAIADGTQSRATETRIRRALNLEILKRENVIGDLLTPSSQPGTAVGIGAGAVPAEQTDR